MERGRDDRYPASEWGNLGGQAMFLRILDRLEEILITSLMLGATVLIFVAVIHRYAPGVPPLYPYAIKIDLGWGQELCILMVVWMAKFAAAYVVRTRVPLRGDGTSGPPHT